MESVKTDLNLGYRHLRGPSLQFLKTFLIVAARGSCKAAADCLCVTPAAVSQQIKQLEHQLGIALFERKANSLALTEAGAHYFESILSLFSRFVLASELVRRRRRRTVVRLRVSSLFFAELVVPRLPKLTREQPDIDLQISTMVSSLAEHPSDLDVSVIVSKGVWKEVRAANLFPQTFVPAGHPGLLLERNIRTAADITNQVLLIHGNRPDLWDQWAATCGIRDLRPKQVFQFDSLSAVVEAADRGLCIVLLSAPVCATRLASGTLREIGQSELKTGDSYLVVTRRDDIMRSEVQRLVEWLSQQFCKRDGVESESRAIIGV